MQKCTLSSLQFFTENSLVLTLPTRAALGPLTHPRWAGSREAELGDGAPAQGEVAPAMTGGASAVGAGNSMLPCSQRTPPALYAM
jgi:hypothetical protein